VAFLGKCTKLNKRLSVTPKEKRKRLRVWVLSLFTQKIFELE